MEVKKNLNNTQRKMLDDIYTERFDKKADDIRKERQAGLERLQVKCLKEQMKDKDIKKFIEAGRLYYEMQTKLDDKFRERGLRINATLHGRPTLSFSTSYYNSHELPEIAAYNTETRRIEASLADTKKVMRAKIHGVAASYEEVDEEIANLLKSV